MKLEYLTDGMIEAAIRSGIISQQWQRLHYGRALGATYPQNIKFESRQSASKCGKLVSKSFFGRTITSEASVAPSHHIAQDVTRLLMTPRGLWTCVTGS